MISKNEVVNFNNNRDRDIVNKDGKNNNALINLEKFKKSLQNRFEFMYALEDDIFKYDDIKDESIIVKVEYYKLVKNSIINDINFLRDMKLETEDEMLKNIILSLTPDQKKELKRMLLELIKNK